MNNKKLWSPAVMVMALSVAFSAAHASALEQTGTPGSAAPIGTYGVEVSAKTGLKTLLPAGWNLYIYKNTPLPSTISWTVQDTWLTALEHFADGNGLAVRADWNNKSLYISTTEVARQEKSKFSSETEVASKTPLPTYTPSSQAQAPAATSKLPQVAEKPAAAKPAVTNELAKTSEEPAGSRISADVLARALAKTSNSTAAEAAPATPAPAAVAMAKPALPTVALAVPANPVRTGQPSRLAPNDRAVSYSNSSDAPGTSVAAPASVAATSKPWAEPVRMSTPAAQLSVAPAATVAVTPAPAAARTFTQPAVPVAAWAATPAVQPSIAQQPAVTPIAPPPQVAALMQATAPAVTPVYRPAATPAPAPQREAPAGQSFARGNMEDVVRAAADKHGYQVSWETVSLPVTGPVTFLGADPAEDMRLLQRSLGNKQSPIAIEVYRGSSLIRITANNQSRDPLTVYDTTYTGTISYGTRTAPTYAAAPLQMAPAPSGAAAMVSVLPARAPAMAAPALGSAASATAVVSAPAQEQAARPAELALHVAKGESLSKALAQFLKANQWEMRWQVPNDMEADFPVDITGTDIKQVLKALLPKLGLDTDMYAPSHVVVIRVLDNSAD